MHSFGKIAACLVFTAVAALASPPFQFSLRDVDGSAHSAGEWAQARAVVLFFVTTDCPLCNGYAPEMNRIDEAYTARGVRFYAVQGDTTIADDEVRRHARDFAYRFPVLLDPQQILARHSGASVTPEAVVLGNDGAVLYLGRIDNRVEDFGKTRVQATEFDLREALDAILAGRPVPHPRTRALGCAITTGAPPTFNKDIAPILYQNCATCHRPGEVAPFSLLTYRDAAKRADQIAAITSQRVMPPWKAEPGYGSFANERRLSTQQIALIRDWAKSGAPEGDARDKPAPPVFPEGWEAGQPDQVLTIPKKFEVAADGPDQYRCFVMPLDLDRDVFLSGIEFRPGSRRVVHHALVYADTTGAARKLAAGSPDGGYPCFGGPKFPPVGLLGGWAPGASPPADSAALSQPLLKGTDVVVQIHYHPSGKPEEDQSALGLHYSAPPTKGRAGIILSSRRIDIPAGDPHYVVKTSVTVPRDVDLFGITPHAHYLGKDMKVTAFLPDGSSQPLIWIKDWDFNWQGQYRYKEPVHIPKDTRIELEYVYDNSEHNPHNPSHPPIRVSWGEETLNEMAVLFLGVVLPSPDDVAGFRRAMRTEYIASFIAEGNTIDDLPPGIPAAQREMIKRAFQAFDKNGDGKLDAQERAALLQYLRARQ
ncbi:MAG TPA: redoxin family protein [Bryobacteraceae bacterium]|nr:redoxin family protein [Bryobacteraceae bacterium]